MPTLNATLVSTGCAKFSQSHFVHAKEEPLVVRVAKVRNFENGNMTVHPCDRRATENDLVEFRSGTVFVAKDPCVSVDWKYSKTKYCDEEALVKFEETPISEFCEKSPTDNLCDEYAPGVVSPSTGVNELEKLSGASTITNTTRSPSPSPSSARRVSSLVSLAMASLTVVVGVM